MNLRIILNLEVFENLVLLPELPHDFISIDFISLESIIDCGQLAVLSVVGVIADGIICYNVSLSLLLVMSIFSMIGSSPSIAVIKLSAIFLVAVEVRRILSCVLYGLLHFDF